MKGRRKHCTENLPGRDHRQTENLEEEPYEEEPSILESEMISSLNTLGRNKSPGVNGGLTGLFQATQTESVEILTRIFQPVWKTEQWTTDWTHPRYIPVFKMGDAKKGSNYRIVALISRASEVTLKMMQQSLLFFFF